MISISFLEKLNVLKCFKMHNHLWKCEQQVSNLSSFLSFTHSVQDSPDCMFHLMQRFCLGMYSLQTWKHDWQIETYGVVWLEDNFKPKNIEGFVSIFASSRHKTNQELGSRYKHMTFATACYNFVKLYSPYYWQHFYKKN